MPLVGLAVPDVARNAVAAVELKTSMESAPGTVAPAAVVLAAMVAVAIGVKGEIVPVAISVIPRHVCIAGGERRLQPRLRQITLPGPVAD